MHSPAPFVKSRIKLPSYGNKSDVKNTRYRYDPVTNGRNVHKPRTHVPSAPIEPPETCPSRSPREGFGIEMPYMKCRKSEHPQTRCRVTTFSKHRQTCCQVILSKNREGCCLKHLQYTKSQSCALHFLHCVKLVPTTWTMKTTVFRGLRTREVCRCAVRTVISTDRPKRTKHLDENWCILAVQGYTKYHHKMVWREIRRICGVDKIATRHTNVPETNQENVVDHRKITNDILRPVHHISPIFERYNLANKNSTARDHDILCSGKQRSVLKRFNHIARKQCCWKLKSRSWPTNIWNFHIDDSRELVRVQ